MQSQDEEIHLLDYLKVLSKRRRVAMTVFAIVVGLAAVYSFLTTPIYQGTAQLSVDLEKNATMTFTEGGTGYIQMKDSGEYFNTQKEILGSRAFADRVVRKLQIDKSAYFLEKKDKRKNSLFAIVVRNVKSAVNSLFPAKAVPANPFSNTGWQPELDPDLTDIILDEMGVEIGKASNLIKISYNSDNPNVAAAMANGIAGTYIEHNLNLRVKPFREAVEWLSAKVVESRSKVEDSEKTLQKYKEEKGIVSFEAKENVVTQKLQELVSQQVQAENRRQEAEVRYNQIKSVIDNPGLLTSVPDIMNNLVIQGLRNDELRLTRSISELSEKYGAKHPQMVKATSELEMVRKNLMAEARKMLNAAKTEYEIARNKEISLMRAMDAQKQEVLGLTRQAIDFNVVAGEAESNKQFYELLLKKMQEASLSSGINISNAQIVDGAIIPKDPAKPKKALNMILAATIGLFGGIFAAFFVEYMDNTVKTPEDVDEILGLPFLGFVPSVEEKEHLYMSSDSKSALAESYRTIRTSIMLSSAEKPPQVILITSAVPQEGKTTTAANLAMAMAQMGGNVVLIDADMRRPNIHKIFNLENSAGLSNAIVEHNSPAIKTIPDFPDLSILVAGTMAPNPSELLSSERMKELLTELRARYDHVILDSSPLMAVSDPLVLSSLADGVILVVWGGMTGRDLIKKASQSLTGINAKILGVVLNKIAITKWNKYQYYQYYPYYQEESGKKKR
ncbi:MAG: polysaccharide biosynthesis tyrosine autokinase [Candidatus Subteraquimicrobiales bacterium]|nr:polysaccharide biosynthesis tyrosine autokinase [Candidatus Subteraquimicrobiales bacterium]